MENAVKTSFIYSLSLCCAIILFIVSGNSVSALPGDPMSQMKATVEEVQAILDNERLNKAESWAEKKVLIRAVVSHRFNFEEMSKRTLARNWKKRTDEEKKYFVEKFSQLLEHTYINRLEDYTGAEVFFKKQNIKGNKAVVYTIIKSERKEIPVSYKMLLKGDKWLVYDVIIEGVSLVRNYRSQFKKIVGKEKYAGLIKRVEAKVDNISSPKAKD